jgi:hypothetical protein
VRFFLAVAAIMWVLLAGFAGQPTPVAAACGGGSDDGWLARYNGRHAHTIVLGRLLDNDRDGRGTYLIEVERVYRGEADSLIEADGRYLVDVGGCTAQSAQPGHRVVFTNWTSTDYGPMPLVFPHIPGRGWIIEHYGGTTSLDGLLRLLGVLPDTSTAETVQVDSAAPQVAWGLVAAIFGLAYWFHRRVRMRRSN